MRKIKNTWLPAAGMAAVLALSGCGAAPASHSGAVSRTASSVVTTLDSGNVIAEGALSGVTSAADGTDGTYTEETDTFDGKPLLGGSYKISDCITLGNLNGLAVNVNASAPTESASESDAVVYVKLQNDDKQTVTDDHATAEYGDLVTVNLTLFEDGTKVDDRSMDNYEVGLGSGTLQKDVEAAIPGMMVGDVKEVNVTYPADNPDSEVAGKTVTYQIRLNSIERAPDPTESEIAEAENTLDEESASESNEALYEAAKQAIISASDIKAYPEELIRELRSQYESAYVNAYGSLDDYLNAAGMTRAAFKEAEDQQVRDGADRKLVFLALKDYTGITKAEGVNITKVSDDPDEALYDTMLNAVLPNMAVTYSES